MKTKCRLFGILALALALCSCSRESQMQSPDYAFVGEWATLIAKGETDESRQILLTVVQGRTDEDMSLISSGAVAFLVLNAPPAGDGALASGVYKASSEGKRAYTLNYGLKKDGEFFDGSYIAVRLPGSSYTKFYPVGGGQVSVSAGENGVYEIDAEVDAGGFFFDFEYVGSLQASFGGSLSFD